MRIGEIVKEKRLAKKLTMADLGEKAGVTHKTISCLESGKNENVTIESLRGLAAALGCSVVDLLPEEDKKKPKKKQENQTQILS